mmetsp:Transcript_5345/g.20128  ORF Transcript_5345/g.20128 Transcript_5345/m.20128 type:complete len:205 (+) Transcript_5345:1991-2605(+)
MSLRSCRRKAPSAPRSGGRTGAARASAAASAAVAAQTRTLLLLIWVCAPFGPCSTVGFERLPLRSRHLAAALATAGVRPTVTGASAAAARAPTGVTAALPRPGLGSSWRRRRCSTRACRRSSAAAAAAAAHWRHMQAAARRRRRSRLPRPWCSSRAAAGPWATEGASTAATFPRASRRICSRRGSSMWSGTRGRPQRSSAGSEP